MLKVHSAAWRLYAAVANLPWFVILAYLAFDLLERAYAFYAPAEVLEAGTLPDPAPLVCVQLLLCDEDGPAAARAIDAACTLRWPHYRLEARGAAGRRVRAPARRP